MALGAVVAGCSAGAREAQKLSPEAQALMTKLEKASAAGQIMYGHQDALMYGHTWTMAADESSYDRSDVRMVCGDYPAVIGFDLGGIEKGDPANLDNNRFYQIREAAVKHYERGGIITYSWHPRNPFTGGDAWDVSSAEVVASILEGGEKHEEFMGWLKNMADFIESVQTADGKKVPAIFRPWHEHTGSWFWWGRNLCSVEQYKSLWRMTYGYLAGERGLSNLVWAFSPDACPDIEVFMERYPGDDIIDIIGLDCYAPAHKTQKADYDEFVVKLSHMLDIAAKAAKDHGKLSALTETGTEGTEYESWWTEVLLETVKDSGIAYLLTWRNAPDRPEHAFGPYPGQNSADDFTKFSKNPKVLMLNGIQ